MPGRAIREHIFRLAPQLIEGMNVLRLPTIMRDDRIPPIYQARIPPTANIHPSCYPTHLVSVSPKAAAEGVTPPDAPVAISTVHGTVITAHCTKLPLPPAVQSTQPLVLNLVTCHFYVGSVRAWVLLRLYMYGGSVKNFLEMLLPLPPAFLEDLRPNYNDMGHERPKLNAVCASEAHIHTLAQHVVENTEGGYEKLWERMEFVAEVWRSMCDLGMHDSLLWMALRLAWQVARYALLLKAQGRRV
ncbi:hypothetical protein R3P38DRAFT_2891118 [Favolaschia claudopus]|uniref:Uncharacterized protein n=1 Tax=Favolaschia claudopus TaxID=2862362 RepID=A0AAW0CU83_9AGAR